MHGACFHVGAGKAVVFCSRGSGIVPPLLFRARLNEVPLPLSICTTSHKWLGWMWSPDAGTAQTMRCRVNAAGA